MKVSREKKQEHQQRFIDAFVAEVRARGYAAVTLRDVARAAGLSDGAVYKHFATKEKILLAYYAGKMDRLRLEGETLAGKTAYRLVEKLQALLEFQIGQYEGEKDFLEKTFQPTFVVAGLMWTEAAAMRKAYLGIVGSFLEAARANGEIPEIAWAVVVDEILWGHYVGVMLYWLKDKSEHHEDTSQFIDRTLNLFAALVGGPLLRQAEELVGFLVNRHVMPLLLNLGAMGHRRSGFPCDPASDPAPGANAKASQASKPARAKKESGGTAASPSASTASPVRPRKPTAQAKA
jgi:AcrR family transcriptional regulator